jgi:uncharacterized protein DUF4154
LGAERALAGKRDGRALHGALFALFALLGCAAHAGPARPPSVREVQIEAAFLVNFVRYTDWPAGELPPPAPYVVTVIGTDDVASTMGGVFAAAGPIDGRRIEMRHVEWPGSARSRNWREDLAARLSGSQLVFVQAGSADAAADAIDVLRGLPVLTVSDADGFVAAGGMLGIVRNGTHLGFEANPVSIRDAGLQVSAKVLKLAVIPPQVRR